MKKRVSGYVVQGARPCDHPRLPPALPGDVWYCADCGTYFKTDWFLGGWNRISERRAKRLARRAAKR